MKNFLVFIVTGMVLLLSLEVVAQAQTDQYFINKYEFGSKTYPGIKTGEVYICDISTKYCWELNQKTETFWENLNKNATEKNFAEIGWKTKRLGGNSYSNDGKIIEGKRPIFAKEEELLRAGFFRNIDGKLQSPTKIGD